MKELYPMLALAVLVSLSVVSCQKDLSTEASTAPVAARTILDQPFGNDPSQRADIYLPAGRTKSGTKTLVILHGGYWLTGDKADLNPYIQILQTAYPSLNIVNANYRLANASDPGTQFPAQMADIQLLLGYLNNNRDSLKINTDIALAGFSAGGHLALEYAYKYDVARQVKLVGGMVAPTNFLDPYYLTGPYAATFAQLAYSFIGRPVTDIATYTAASPYYNLSTASQPTFVCFGALDQLAPASSASLLLAKLKALNINYQYYMYPDEGHDFSDPAIYDALAKFSAFLKLYL